MSCLIAFRFNKQLLALITNKKNTCFTIGLYFVYMQTYVLIKNMFFFVKEMTNANAYVKIVW